jgi:hypothetical protein
MLSQTINYTWLGSFLFLPVLPTFHWASQLQPSQLQRQMTIKESFTQRVKASSSLTSFKQLQKAGLLPKSDTPEQDKNERFVVNNIRNAIQSIIEQAKQPHLPDILTDKNRQNTADKEMALKDYIVRTTESWQKLSENLSMYPKLP